MDVSVVIPIYNARTMVEEAVRRLSRVLTAKQWDYEILLRDDGSSNDVRSVFRKIEAGCPRVKCSYNLSNQGLGATLRALFEMAQGRHVIYCDCDLPFGEDIVTGLMEHLHNYDIVVASRYKGGLNPACGLRLIISRLYYFFCRLLFNMPVVDIGSGSLAIRRSALQKLDLKARGFAIHA